MGEARKVIIVGLKWQIQRNKLKLSSVMSNRERISDPCYIPSALDMFVILHKSYGSRDIRNHRFNVKRNIAYKAYSVRVAHFGYNSEYSNAFSTFKNTDCVLFFISLTGYDELYDERYTSYSYTRFTASPTQNVIHDSLQQLAELVKSKEFEKTAFLVVLTHLSDFNAKIESGKSLLHWYFPEYDGEKKDIHAARGFLESKFESVIEDPEKDVRVCVIDAINEASVMPIIDMTQDLKTRRMAKLQVFP